MKIALSLLSAFVVVLSAGAKEPEKKTRSTIPGPYPSIIRMTPPGENGQSTPRGIIQSELGGREMQFIQTASQALNDQSALIELAKAKDGAEQIKAVAESMASSQLTERNEVARIAAANHVVPHAGSTKAISDELGALAGAKFEKAWIERLMPVSEAAVTAYELGAGSRDANIRSFSEAMLPVARARLQLANRLGGRPVAAKPVLTPGPETAVSSREQEKSPQETSPASKTPSPP